MARRYVAVYEEFLDWSRDVRGTTFPVTFRESVAILAHLADQPIDELRRHASHFEDEIKKIPERLARGDAGRTTLVVTLDISDELADRFMGAFEKALEEYDE